jgi:hypothetical protein
MEFRSRYEVPVYDGRKIYIASDRFSNSGILSDVIEDFAHHTGLIQYRRATE